MQSVHGLRCYGNITRTRNVSECLCRVLQVAVVGERRCGKTSLAEALRRSAAGRETAAAAGEPGADMDELAGPGSGWCRLDVVDLSAGRHLDDYGRSLDVDAYILAFDVTSIQAAGSAHHNGTAAALTSRHAARLQMWLQALYEVRDDHHGNWTTRRYANSRTGHLADWTTRGLADAAKRTKTKHAKSPTASASCPVRDLSSTRVV